jgi:hypothetical protein
MSLLYALHFDSSLMPPQIVTTVNAAVSSNQKRTGGYSLNVTSLYAATFSNRANMYLDAALNEFFIQFALIGNVVQSNTSRMFRWKNTGGVVLGGLELDFATSQFRLYTGDFVNLVASSSTVINLLVWNVIELHIKISETEGLIALRVNLNTDVSFTGNTKPETDSAVKFLDFGNLYGSFAYFDDIIINDTNGIINNSWPNGAKVYYLLPTGDGSTMQWTVTPSGLTQYTAIDETIPSSTDYIRAGTTDLINIFSIANLPSDAGSIKAVIPQVFAFKGCIDAPSTLGIGIDVGGGVEYSSDKVLNVSQALVTNIWEQKPGGGNFTSADVNALQLYLKSRP